MPDRNPDPRPGAEPGTTAGLVDELGDRIADLRAHLCHAHPLRPEWTEALDSADLAALHRRLHGRAVHPDPSLVEVHTVERATERDERAVTALPLEDATRPEGPLVWLPLRVADRVHEADAPGHTDRGGCRACADVIDAVIHSMTELDVTPHLRIARLEAELEDLHDEVTAARAALAEAHETIAVVQGAAGKVTENVEPTPSSLSTPSRPDNSWA